MKNKEKFSAKRRAALKKSIPGALATGALATAHTWKKPIVDSIIIPAHATTTDDNAASNEDQGPQKSIAITNLSVTGASSDVPELLVNNPVSGTNVGAVNGANDAGNMSVSGVISPPPAPGTQIAIAVNAAADIDNPLFEPCVFDAVCPVSVPVDSTDGEFTFASSVEGLDDGDNIYTLTASCIGAPDVVLQFNITNT